MLHTLLNFLFRSAQTSHHFVTQNPEALAKGSNRAEGHARRHGFYIVTSPLRLNLKQELTQGGTRPPGLRYIFSTNVSEHSCAKLCAISTLEKAAALLS